MSRHPRTVVSTLLDSAPVLLQRSSPAEHYDSVRQTTEKLCEPLATEDYVVQSMCDVSPTKWHLAHTTWFFETFVLAPNVSTYRPFHPGFGFLFNSYYNAVGDRIARDRRGLLSRPTVAEVFRYRRHVDDAMRMLLARSGDERLCTVAPFVRLGLNHEQQHQELILTDIKHVFSCNPLRPAYTDTVAGRGRVAPLLQWHPGVSGLQKIGHAGRGFAYDNESPRHTMFVNDFELASRPVTSGEFLEFMANDGYTRPELWLSDGWNTVQNEHWVAPLYWEQQGGQWCSLTLGGFTEIDPAAPVCHVSYYEADAFARWAGARLPTEVEWEVMAQECEVNGNFLESGRFHPMPAERCDPAEPVMQLFGDVWEWTSSPYLPYPGYRPPSGARGEYNGKFMCNQMVLRGGSCLTPRSHIRASYRNFFPPNARWQFTGLRLARDA